MLGVEPSVKNRFKDTIAKKRKEYVALARNALRIDQMNEESSDKILKRQIAVDLPRTNTYSCAGIKEFITSSRIQQLMGRVLLVWSLRHPACGYVQGINDLMTPFLIAFAQEIGVIARSNASVSTALESEIEVSYWITDRWRAFLLNTKSDQEQHWDFEQVLENMEADVYMALTKVLDSIQDNYTSGQPGIQRMNEKLRILVQRLDPLFL